MSWIITHISTICFLLLFATAAGSATIARHEMTRADLAVDHLKTANAEIDREHENDVKIGAITNEYEKNISVLNGKLAASRLRAAVCIVPSDNASSGSHGAAGKGEPVGSMGISSGFIDELMAEGARYQQQLAQLQRAAAVACGSSKN